MKKLAYRRDVPFFCDYSWEDPSDNLLKWNVCVNVKNKVNSVEESVKEKEEDESHEERGEEGIRVICGHCFFIYVWNVVGVSEIPESSFNRYGEGWTFSYNGQEKVIDIPVRQKVDAGDTYEISHVVSWELPSDVRLLYRSLQQEVEIYVDETLIYKYPSEDYIAGLTPNHWNMVELPEDVEGKLLTIRLNSEYEQFSGKIGELYLGEYAVLFSHVRAKYFLALLVGLVVGVIGCVIFLTSAFIYQKKAHHAEMALGVLFILTSLWMCGEAKVPFAKISPLSQYFLVFFSLLLLPAAFYLYVLSLIHISEPTRH